MIEYYKFELNGVMITSDRPPTSAYLEELYWHIAKCEGREL